MTSTAACKGTDRDAAGPRRWGINRRRIRPLVGLIDQALSGLTNFALVVLVAQVSSVEDFGHFALWYTVLTVALALTRSTVGIPLVLSAARASGVHAGQAVALTAVIGTVSGMVIYVAATASGGDGSGSLAVLFGVAGPIVLVQDCLRYCATAAARPHLALRMDFVWALFIAGAALMVLWRAPTPPQVMCLWVVGGGASVLFGWRLAGRPTFSGLLPGLRESQAIRFRMFIDAVLAQSPALLIATLPSIVIGLTATAGLRGAGALMGPLNLAFAALAFSVLPELVRVSSERQVYRVSLQIGGMLSVGAVVWGMGLLLIPDLGQLLLADSWPAARAVLPFLTVEYAFLALFITALTALLAMGHMSSHLRSRLTYTCAALTFGALTTVLVQDTRAIAAGLALAAAGGMLQSLRASIRAGRKATS